MRFHHIMNEISKQLNQIPTYDQQAAPIPLNRTRKEMINRQIEQAMAENVHLIFILGPLGVGKSTQTQYFIHKHPEIRYVEKSFMKIDNLEFAYLHLTSLSTRFVFLMLSFLMSLALIIAIPATGALPFLLGAGFLFVRNYANLIYIFHEIVDDLFQLSPKVVFIDDLERSSLSLNSQWALLANLWQHHNAYIISMGYPPDDKDGRLKLLEYAMKLNGRVIEILPDGKTNYNILKQFNGFCPFRLQFNQGEEEGWICLFTPREIQLFYNLACTRAKQASERDNLSPSKNDVKQMCVHVFLEELARKMKWKSGEIVFDEKGGEICLFNHPHPLPEEFRYLQTFAHSLHLHQPVKLTFRQSSTNTSEQAALTF